MEKVDRKYIVKAMEKNAIIEVKEPDYSFNFFSMLSVVDSLSVDTLNGVNLSNQFFVGVSVEKDGNVTRQFFNRKGEYLGSLPKLGVKFNSIRAYDLAFSIASAITFDTEVVTRVPQQFIKAYPEFKRIVEIRINNEVMANSSTVCGVDKTKYEEKMREYQKSVFSKIDERVKN